ncbi:hypothetical protein EGT51_00800 [Levilactobacillus suantsaiihabitans]|uniref:Uncharacterized protein n=1 Tax=Levilactobacillus suantsaiihabitans TaxID=2487722 RepID=A0A4Z0JBW7_9LACO|nr:hypothetical protein EGT51_00800 [Levilactobacillus suantsaiihabitans]
MEPAALRRTFRPSKVVERNNENKRYSEKIAVKKSCAAQFWLRNFFIKFYLKIERRKSTETIVIMRLMALKDSRFQPHNANSWLTQEPGFTNFKCQNTVITAISALILDSIFSFYVIGR